jgi:endonuclease/exonuclease/phosphatase family metal-dependent hydrolase
MIVSQPETHSLLLPSLPSSPLRSIPRNHHRSPAQISPENLKSNHSYGDDLDDLLITHDEGKNYTEVRPGVWKEQTVRIYFQNVNGIKVGPTPIDIIDVFYQMSEIRADVFAFAETKVNSNQQVIRTLFHSAKQQVWNTRQCKLMFGHTAVSFEGPNKPGGLLLGVTNCLVGRVRHSYSDPYGRWCGCALLGRDTRTVHIIVAYQAVQDSGNYGATTFYEQQRTLLRQAGISNPSPRKIFIQDLTSHVQQLRQQNCDIILMGDFNEEVGSKPNGMQSVLEAGHLTDCHVHRHGLATETPTYARGSRRVDYVFLSQRLLPHLAHCGTEPFNHRIFSDHRGLFLDLRPVTYTHIPTHATKAERVGPGGG